jgi:predicted MFS family arabinose efflux permease
MAAMMAGASAPSPFYPVLQQELGFSAAVMTGIFAIYTLALLSTLLVVGSLSDHIGRRPVVSVGLLLLAASIVIFWHAGSVVMLMEARVLQGVAAGMLLSSISAMSVDFEPADRPGSSAIWNSVMPLVGLAAGAGAAGAIMDLSPTADADVFGFLTIAYLLLAAIVWLVPETAPRHHGLLASLKPRVGVPAAARAAFMRSAPAVIAGWATGGLYLALGAPIIHGIFGVSDYFIQGLVVMVLSGAGAIACYFARKRTPRQVTLYGTAALAIGTALTLAAVHFVSLPAYMAAVALAGTGFGTCFLGVMRSVIPRVASSERGEFFAALFTLSYVAFGLPTVIAGFAIPYLGLAGTTMVYGGVIIVFSAAAGLMRRFGTDD